MAEEAGEAGVEETKPDLAAMAEQAFAEGLAENPQPSLSPATEKTDAPMEGTGDAEGAEPPEPADPPEEDAEEAEAAGKPSGEGEDEHPLLKAVRGEAGNEAPVELPERVKEWFAKNDIEDPEALLTEIPRKTARIKDLETKLSEAADKASVIDQLSEEAKNVLRMDLDGRDWKKEVLSRPSLDFSLTAEKQDKKALLDTYAKVEDDDWEEYNDADGDPKSKALVEARLEKAVMLYDKDRDASVAYGQKREREIKAYEDSKAKSLDYVFKAVQGSEAFKDEIEEAFNGLTDMFYEKDGFTVKPDALLNAWRLKKFDALFNGRVEKVKQEVRDENAIALMRRTGEKKASARAKGGDLNTGKTPQQIADEEYNKALGHGGFGKR